MNDRHYSCAELLLDEGVEVVKRISVLADDRDKATTVEQRDQYTQCMDELGKKAMGIWAQAQVHAILAQTR